MAATGWYLRVFGHPELPAAQFALRSSYLKGVILCDEGSLGKTYEALLAVTGKSDSVCCTYVRDAKQQSLPGGCDA